MTAPATRVPGGAYEGAGRQVALAVRGYSSVIVTSDDLVAAGHTALGIALAESAHRLVMIADLGNEIPPIQGLVDDGDTHGIYDSFAFGTSFVRVAREVEGAKNLFVLPSGTESPVSEEILSSPRWGRFASEFANADELLILVCSANAPGIAKLAAQVDGVVLVGVKRLENVPDANLIARVPHPTIVPPPKINLAPLKQQHRPSRKAWLVVSGLLFGGVAIGALIGKQIRSGKQIPPRVASAPIDSSADSAASVANPAVLPLNPGDSASATPFSIEILASNTAEGANFELQRHGASMPTPTISLVPIGDTEATWYKVHSGAFADSAEAERRLASLRRRRIVPDSAGSVVRAPLALLVDSVGAEAGMSSRIRDKLEGLRGKGVFGYALIQRDGSARIYSGAFERPQQSALAATALRVAGLTPVLAYRTGRLP